MKINSKLKLSKFSYLILLSGIIVVAGTVSFTLAAPLSGLVVNPASTLDFKGTQFAYSFNTPTAGSVKSIEVLFPAGTTILVGDFAFISVVDSVTGATINGTNLGTTTFTDDGGPAPTLIFTFNDAVSTPADADWFVMISKVRNPQLSVKQIQVSSSVTTKDIGGSIIDGPTSGNYVVQRLYDPNQILNAINSKGGDICIGKCN
jgi:hypothetical protein